MKSGGELYLGFPIFIRIFDVKTHEYFTFKDAKKNHFPKIDFFYLCAV